METNDQNKQKPLKMKKVRIVAVNPAFWDMIVSYINDMPIAFANAMRAAEIQKNIRGTQLMEVEVPDVEEKEKSE